MRAAAFTCRMDLKLAEFLLSLEYYYAILLSLATSLGTALPISGWTLVCHQNRLNSS